MLKIKYERKGLAPPAVLLDKLDFENVQRLMLHSQKKKYVIWNSISVFSTRRVNGLGLEKHFDVERQVLTPCDLNLTISKILSRLCRVKKLGLNTLRRYLEVVTKYLLELDSCFSKRIYWNSSIWYRWKLALYLS